MNKKLYIINKIAKIDKIFLFLLIIEFFLSIIKYTKVPIRNSYILNGSKKKLILLSKKVIANIKEVKKIIKNIK